jgi:hypothetical protein
VRSVASGVRNINTLFFNLGGPGTSPTRSVSGHVTPNLCFCILCDLEGTLCVLVRPGRETSMRYFSYLGGPMRVPQEAHHDMLGSVGHVVHSGVSGP